MLMGDVHMPTVETPWSEAEVNNDPSILHCTQDTETANVTDNIDNPLERLLADAPDVFQLLVEDGLKHHEIGLVKPECPMKF